MLDFYTLTNLVPVLATSSYCFIHFWVSSAQLIVLFSGSKEPLFANSSLLCSIEVFFAHEECPLLLLFITVVAVLLLLLLVAVVGGSSASPGVTPASPGVIVVSPRASLGSPRDSLIASFSSDICQCISRVHDSQHTPGF